jgi:hypothetical protein
MINPLRPPVFETQEKKKKAAGMKGQPRPEPEPQEEGPVNSLHVMQIIKSVRTVRRTPQEILAAFNNTKSNQTAYKPPRQPPPPVPEPSTLVAAPARKSKSPTKALPMLVVTSPEGDLTHQVPEMAIQQPIAPPPLCPTCGDMFHLRCPITASELAQHDQELRSQWEAGPIRFIEDHQSNERNPGMSRAVTGKRGVSDLLVSPEVQSSGLPSPAPIVDFYRSEITIQSPGGGSSSPPSAHEQTSDDFDEIDYTEPLFELAAKTLAANLVSRSPTPIAARPSAEMSETSDEDAKVECENSENDERQVVLLVSSQARRKSSESYHYKSSDDSPLANDMPSPASQPITLTAPPVVQSASLIRARSKSTSSPSPPTPTAAGLPPELAESLVIEKLRSPILHDTPTDLGNVKQPQNEKLEPTQILHHVCWLLECVSLQS